MLPQPFSRLINKISEVVDVLSLNVCFRCRLNGNMVVDASTECVVNGNEPL